MLDQLSPFHIFRLYILLTLSFDVYISQQSLPFTFTDQNLLHISHFCVDTLHHECYAS